jgi:hypothetical protein
MALPVDVVGPCPSLGKVDAPPRSRSSLSSEVEVESEPRVGRGRDCRLGPWSNSSPGVGRSGAHRPLGLSLSPSPGVGRGGVRHLLGLSPSPSPGVGRSGVRCLPGLSPSSSPGSGEAEFPMTPEAGLGCCQPRSVEWLSGRSGAGGAIFLSDWSVERRSDGGHFGSIDWKACVRIKVSGHLLH